jgi:hypothetical protein
VYWLISLVVHALAIAAVVTAFVVVVTVALTAFVQAGVTTAPVAL